MDRQDLLTIEQAAARVDRSTRTLRRWVSLGKIKYYRDGHPRRGRLLFELDAVTRAALVIRTLYPS